MALLINIKIRNCRSCKMDLFTMNTCRNISPCRICKSRRNIDFPDKRAFAHVRLGWIALIAFFMLFAAGREVTARQKKRFRAWWGFGVGTGSMFVSSFAVTIFALTAVIGNKPWYAPQYAIPLLGMLLGNTMNGIALGINHLTQAAWQQRAIIEQRLMLGEDRSRAIFDIRRESIRTGMIPIINAMAAAGIISLPGMMTGQILSGVDPLIAVRYQMMVMLMILGSAGISVAVYLILMKRNSV